MSKNDAGEVWGIWAEPTATNPYAVAQWCFVNGTRDEAEAEAAYRREMWREYDKVMWTYEARIMRPVLSARLGVPPVEELARALHAEATQDTLRSTINDCPPGHRMQTQEQRVCGIAWSRLKSTEREVYLARAVGLLSFIENLKK